MGKALLLMVLLNVSMFGCGHGRAISPMAPTGIESDAVYKKVAGTKVTNFEFRNASALEIARTLATLFEKQLQMSRNDDIIISLQQDLDGTVGSSWKRYVAFLRGRGLEVKASGNMIRIYRP